MGRLGPEPEPDLQLRSMDQDPGLGRRRRTLRGLQAARQAGRNKAVWEGGPWRPQPPSAEGQMWGVKTKRWELSARIPGSKGRSAGDPDFSILKKGRNLILSHQGVW